MMPACCQLARPKSPNVQKTMAARLTSSAKYCMIVVPPEKSAESATPDKTIASGVICRNFERPRTTRVESIEKPNAQMDTSHGLLIVTPSGV